MNVNCNSNENIYEATITISFPCKQTIMEHDIKKFNLTQFESRIWNLVNLLVRRKKLCFSRLCRSKYHRSIMLPLQCDFFFKMCTFSYGHLFLVSIFYQPTSEKNQVHSGDLTNCKQTWQLIKFYLIENMKGDRGNWLAQLKFPFLSILWLFLLP